MHPCTHKRASVKRVIFTKLNFNDCGLFSRYDIQVTKKQMFSPRSLIKNQYCGDLLLPRGTVRARCSTSDRQSSNYESCLKCLESEGSVISFISRSSGSSFGPVQSIMCTKVAYKTHSFISSTLLCFCVELGNYQCSLISMVPMKLKILCFYGLLMCLASVDVATTILIT